MHWPNGIEEPGGLRSQFTHVIDVAPTILEAAGLPEPAMVNGVLQSPMEGTSMLYTFNDAGAPERHALQYFEMFGNRGIYHKGWSAVTKHKTPWILVGGVLPAFDDDVWELYDGSTDFSQARNLAAEKPELLAKLQRLWLIEATKYQVLPIDDRSAEHRPDQPVHRQAALGAARRRHRRQRPLHRPRGTPSNRHGQAVDNSRATRACRSETRSRSTAGTDGAVDMTRRWSKNRVVGSFGRGEADPPPCGLPGAKARCGTAPCDRTACAMRETSMATEFNERARRLRNLRCPTWGAAASFAATCPWLIEPLVPTRERMVTWQVVPPR